MIALRKLRDLDLAAPLQADRGAFVCAASGLVRVGERLHVIADDEHHLATFVLDGTAPGTVMALIQGELPVAKPARKRLKPDFEALARLPAFAGYAHGALLALGSGSRANRCRAVLLALGADGGIEGEGRILDFSGLYGHLSTHLAQLNIEAATVVGAELRLLQRGGKSGAVNACIRLELDALLAALGKPGTLAGLRPRAIHAVDLGQDQGLPWCFSDAIALGATQMLFTAITEDTEDSFEDGRCGGAAIGILDADLKLRMLDVVAPIVKIEGIEAHVRGDRIELLLVTDDDDPTRPSALYAGEMTLALP